MCNFFLKKRLSIIFVLSKLYKISFRLFTEAANHFSNGFIFLEKLAWIILQFSLQLRDTLKGGHVLLADDFIFPGEILVKPS